MAWPRAAAAFAVLGLLAGPVAARQPQQLQGAIRGVVIDGITRKPVAGATVSVTGMTAPSVQTDEQGAFAFLVQGPATGVRVQATKSGFLTGYKGQLGSQDNVGSSFDVAAGEQKDGIVIRIWSAGSVRGRVTEESGEPSVKASVIALTRILVGGQSRWWRASVPSATDDRGEFLIERLPPGDYVIAARPQPSVLNGMVPQPAFHPGVPAVGMAIAVTVNGDAQRADVRLAAATKVRDVSGNLSGADRSPLGMSVRLAPVDQLGATTGFDDLVVTADRDGRFTFPRVPDGTYRIRVCEFPRMTETPYTVGGDFNRTLTGYMGPRPADSLIVPALPADPTWVVDLGIVVDNNLRNPVNVVLRQGARIRGRVVFGGQKHPPSPDELLTVPLIIRRAEGGESFDIRGQAVPQPRIERDSTFSSAGLPPGDYVIGTVGGFAPINDWYVTAIRQGGRDVLGRSIGLGTENVTDVVVTFMDRPTEIVGTVSASSGPATDARVIVFPKDRADRNEFWANPAPRRVRQAFPDSKGNFRAPVPAGDYFAVAVTSDLPAMWMSADYLQLLQPRSVAVTVRPGETARVGVTAVAVPARR